MAVPGLDPGIDPAIQAPTLARKAVAAAQSQSSDDTTWMAGLSPAMTVVGGSIQSQQGLVTDLLALFRVGATMMQLLWSFVR